MGAALLGPEEGVRLRWIMDSIEVGDFKLVGVWLRKLEEMEMLVQRAELGGLMISGFCSCGCREERGERLRFWAHSMSLFLSSGSRLRISGLQTTLEKKEGRKEGRKEGERRVPQAVSREMI